MPDGTGTEAGDSGTEGMMEGEGGGGVVVEGGVVQERTWVDGGKGGGGVDNEGQVG